MPRSIATLFAIILLSVVSVRAAEQETATRDDKGSPAEPGPEVALKLSPALTAAIEGVRLEGAVTLAPGGPEVMLNGAGVRSKFFAKLYVGALYLEQLNKDREAIFADRGPKRIALHILADEVAAPEFIASMNDGLAANLVPHELALIEKRIRDLNSMMSSVKTLRKGGVVYLDYIPRQGTRITINGQEKLTIPGEDFFRAMLHIWIGYTPVDGRLRDAMLGHR